MTATVVAALGTSRQVSMPPLRRSGRIIVLDDGTPFDWREASAFTLVKRVLDGDDIRPLLHGLRAEGITMVRALGALGHPGWGPWRFTPSTPGYDDALEETCRLTAQAGLYLRFTHVPDVYYTCHPDFATALPIAHWFVAQQNAVLAAWRHVVSEGTNEPPGRGDTGHGWPTGDPSVLQVMMADMGRLTALGAEHGARGHLATYDVPPADFVTSHVERRIEFDDWNWLKRMMSDYGVIAHGTRPAVSGEPINAGNRGQSGDFAANPAIWYAYGCGSRLAESHGYGACFHFHDGLTATMPTGVTLDCLRAFIQGCRDVPLSVRGGLFVNGHHPTSPWAGYSQTDPPSDDRPFRIFGQKTDGVYWGIALRHRPGWSWPTLRYPVERIREVSDGQWAGSLWRSV